MPLPRWRAAGQLLAVLASAFAAVTCDLVTAPKPGEGSAITVNYLGDTVLAVGTKIVLDASVTQGAVAIEGARLSLTSSDESIVDVTDVPVGADTIEVKARGRARIRATLQGSSLGENPPFAEVEIRGVAASVQIDDSLAVNFRNIGDSVVLRVSVFDVNGNRIDSVADGWQSANTNIVSVNSAGKLLARANGNAISVTATVDTVSTAIPVTVQQRLAGYRFTPAQLIVTALNRDVVVRATPLDAGGTPIPANVAGVPTPSFTSLNTGVLSVTALTDTTFRVSSIANDTTSVRIVAGTLDLRYPITVGQVAQSIAIQGSSTPSIDALQDTLRLRARAFDGENVEVQGRSVIWTSLNTAIATVDASGLVTALSGGTVLVTTRMDAALDTVAITVQNLPASIRTSQQVFLPTVKDSVVLSDTVVNKLGAQLSGIAVAWRSLDPSIASVDPVSGLVVAEAIGATLVIGQLANGAADTTQVLVANRVASVAISSPDTTLGSIGDTVTLRSDIRNARSAPLPASFATWSLTDSSVASVNAGFVTALRQGFTRVIVGDPQNPARTDSILLIVSNAPEQVTLNRVRDTLTAPTRTLQYVADVRNARGAVIAGAGVTFRTVNASIASISAGGLATALAVGTTGVIAEIGSGAGLRADTALLVVTNDAVALTVSPTAFTIASVGATTALAADARNAVGGSVTGVSFVWSSSNDNVATVSSTGVVTGIAVGSAVITAQLGTLTATADINVTNAPDAIDIAPLSVTLASINDSVAPPATLLNALGAPLPRTAAQWISDAAAVATVTPAGIIVATGRGSAIITARNPIDIARRDSIFVTVTNAPDSINVEQTLDSLPSLNRTLQYTAAVFNARRGLIPGEPVTWTSRNGSIATVSATTGLATSVGIGSTWIVGTSGTVSDSARIVVSNNAATLQLNPASIALGAVGDAVTLTAVARNELGNIIVNPAATWSSANPAVASVSTPGPASSITVSGLAVGNTIITAIVDGVTQTVNVTVANPAATLLITSGNLTLASIGDMASPSVDFRNALNQPLARDAAIWTTSDPNVASVSNTGVITAVAAGVTTITATSPANAALTSSITVTVTNAPATLTVAPAGTTNLTAVGQTVAFSATVLNAAGNAIAVPNPSVSWSANPAGIVSIDASTGVATALAPGTTTITGTAGVASNTATVTVAQLASAATSTISASQTTITANGAATSTITVRLKDAGGANLAASGGTVSLSLAGTGSLSAVTDHGDGSYTATLTAPTTLGSGAVSAAINGASITTGDPLIAYVAGPASKYILTQSTSAPVAGGTVTITAQQADQFNNPVTAPRTITWTSTGGGSFPGTSTTNASGIATVTFTSSTVSNTAHTVTATDDFGISGTSTVIQTIPGGAAKYLITTSTSNPQAAGAVVVTAQLADANDNPVLIAGRSVAWSSTGAGGSFSASPTFTNAAGVATVTFTAGTGAGTVHTVSALDNGGLSGTSGNLTVGASALDHFLIEAAGGGAIGTQAAGTPFNVRITARDMNGNTVGGFGGTVLLTSTGTLSGSPVVSGTFVNGVLASQPVTITNTGSVTLSATKAVTGESGTSAAFTVDAGALDHFDVEAAGGGSIGTQAANAPFNIRLTARDAHNNVVTAFTGPGATATLTSTGNLSGAPLASNAFSSGVLASQPVTMTNAGSFTITATALTKSGVSNSFTVGGGTATGYQVTSSSFAPQAGSSVTITAQLVDGSGNAVLESGRAVNWSKTGTGGSFATPFSVTNGSGIATVLFTTHTASNTTHTVTATDNTALTGTSANIVTGAGAPTNLIFSAQPASPQIVNTAFGVTVTARDANNNTATGFNGNVTLSITGGTGTLGAALGGTVTVAASNGVATFSNVSIDRAGINYRLTATMAGPITVNSNQFTVNNPNPTLTALTPASGDRLQTLDVVFTGTGFLSGVTTVSTGANITVNNVTVTSSTSLTANITIAVNAATGPRNFTVTNPAPGGGTSGAQTFTVNNPAPTLTAIAPTSGNRLQTLDVVFTGTGFITGVSSVNVGADITVNTTTVNSATQITANITIGSLAATGARNFTVTNAGPGGGTTAAQSFTVNNPAPTLTAAAPGSGVQGQTGLNVVLTGTNFIDGTSSVGFSNPGITVNSTTVNSATQITANISISAGAATGAGTVSVTNAAPGGGTSATQPFTVNAPAVPTLTSISPANANRLQTLDVTFTGTGFVAGVSTVDVGAGITVNTMTVNSATQITANITVGATAATGARSFTVTNTPAGGTSAGQTFTVNNPAPTLTAIAPTSGNRLQTLDVIFTGTNFIQGTSTVNTGAGITVNTTTVNSPTSLTANITIGAGAATGNRSFSVTNAGPGGGTSGNQTFAVNNPAPTIASATPSDAVQGQANLDVVLAGTNFISAVSSVTFANPGITVHTTTVNSSTQITVNISVGAGAATGAGNVTITNAGPGGGSAVLTNGFTINGPAAPTLTAIAPASGDRLQTLDVVFTGTNFVNGVSSVNVGPGITVNGTPTVNSPTQITANLTITAAAATGTRQFTVTNASGGGTSGTQDFTVNNPAPTLTAASPNTGVQGQTGLDVVLTGTGFINGASDVDFSEPGINVNSVTVNSATQITANISITSGATTGAGTVTVTNAGPGGGTSGTQAFTVNAPAVPTLATLNPTSGTRGQTLDVVFTGTGFAAGVSTVDVGPDITVNNTTVNSATQITANISIGMAAAPGARDFTVTNTPAGGTSGAASFTVNNPAPTLTAIAPTTASRLQTGVSLTLTGSNFISGVSSVNVPAGVTLNSTTVDNAGQITINVDFTAAVATGPVNFSVTNAAPGGGTSATQSVTVSNPAPTLTAIAPTSGERLQTLDVVFTGTGFITGVSSVNVSSGITVNTTTVNSSTQITANITIGPTAATGNQSFSVTNIGPGGGTSGNQTFAVNNPAPTVTAATPNSGVQGQANLSVVVTGTNFINNVTTAAFEDPLITVHSFTVTSPTSGTASISIGAGAALGAGDITVTNPVPGGGSSTLTDGFTVNAPVTPTLTAIAPNAGNRLQTLDVVFTGTEFVQGLTTVDVPAGFAVNTVTVQSSTSLTANITVAASAPTGASVFTVTNAGAGTSAGQNFTVSNPAPTLTNSSPASADPGTTFDLVLTGTNFIQGVSTVGFSSNQQLTINTTTVNSPTQMTVNITLGGGANAGVRTFSVSNAAPGGGTSATRNLTIN